jgi:hypothetical protein
MLRKHTHIPDNDYWGICLFHVVWTNFFCNYSYVVHMEYIYIYIFPSTEQCAWADNLPERVQILGHAHIICITVQENIIILILSNILRFTLKICFWADFNVMQLILDKIKWHIKWKYLIQKFHDICLSSLMIATLQWKSSCNSQQKEHRKIKTYSEDKN